MLSVFFISAHLIRGKVFLVLISFITYQVEHFFICILFICIPYSVVAFPLSSRLLSYLYFSFFKNSCLFILGCSRSSRLCAGFFLMHWAGATLCWGAWASHCSGFSCCGAWTLSAPASVVGAQGLISCGLGSLERRLSNCGTGALVALSMWIFPGPGIKLVSLALAGKFLSTVPPGQSCIFL